MSSGKSPLFAAGWRPAFSFAVSPEIARMLQAVQRYQDYARQRKEGT